MQHQRAVHAAPGEQGTQQLIIKLYLLRHLNLRTGAPVHAKRASDRPVGFFIFRTAQFGPGQRRQHAAQWR